jgi:hypothetical protein
VSEPGIAVAAVLVAVQAEVRAIDTTVNQIDKRLAVLEAVAITPARLVAILTAAGVVAAIIFGGITAAAVLIQ